MKLPGSRPLITYARRAALKGSESNENVAAVAPLASSRTSSCSEAFGGGTNAASGMITSAVGGGSEEFIDAGRFGAGAGRIRRREREADVEAGGEGQAAVGSQRAAADDRHEQMAAHAVRRGEVDVDDLAILAGDVVAACRAAVGRRCRGNDEAGGGPRGGSGSAAAVEGHAAAGGRWERRRSERGHAGGDLGAEHVAADERAGDRACRRR